MVYHLVTDRQAEYVELACAGRSDEEIAATMGITKGTVRAYRGSLLARLRLRTLAEVCASIDSDTPHPAPLRKRDGKRA